MTDILMIIAGLVLLFFGGEGLIKGAVSLARQYGLSKLLVSAVIVGFGTSMPEMTVSIGAALKGAPDIVLGNVVGSNIANILLIVGVAAILSPISMSVQSVRRDTWMMLAACFLLCALSLWGMIDFVTGAGMLAVLAAYIAWSYRLDKAAQSDLVAHIQEDIEGEPKLSTRRALTYSIGGLLLLLAGSYLMVEGAVAIARNFGISEAVIGLTIIAVGTSLPELATAVVAALRRHNDVIIGNVLGSNIFNILSILGITAMVQPVPVTGQIAQIDIWFMLAAALTLSFFLLRGVSMGRVTGAVLLLTYTGYTGWLYLGTG
jgi:cation:H+ antiporter